MELTVKQLIEKLEKVENKNADVYFEMPRDCLSVDLVILDSEGDVTLSNAIGSNHCFCDKCKQFETKL